MFRLYQRMLVEMDRAERTLIIPTPLGIIALLYAIVAVSTFWFTVGKGEQAVVQTFGAYTASYNPGGPYFRPPWPFAEHTIVEVQKAGQIPIGFTLDEKTGKTVDIPEQSEVLTGDLNTVMIDSMLQYQRLDAKRWLFVADNPEKQLFLLAQSALRRAVAARGFDEILTTDRPAAQVASEERIRALVEKLGLGVNIIAHQIQDTHPPKEVAPSFADVTNAGEDKQKLIQQGEGYRKSKTAAAIGEVNKVLADASGYKVSRVNDAKGATARFDAVYAQYKSAPQLTRDRMRYEALETVLAGKPQIIDMSHSGGAPLVKLLDVAVIARQSKEPK
jgi:membrane protease subunit HflK